MTRDPETGIRVLDRTVDYADGAEDRLLEILAGADDPSALSDELAGHIDDWPTRYHLSRERSNLLRPLRIGPRHRVLEIGAGTGAISRSLGETGATVVALEGSLVRARAAHARCADLDNVEIVCGALDAFDDPEKFDLVCLIGVLEYAGAGDHGVDPETFMRSAASHLKPDGLLAVAIENQIGLKYLLGFEEDHLGRPWVGLEGYSDSDEIRTYSRRRLGSLLDSCGLDHHRWLYPYPDYKLPTVVVADAAFDQPDAAALLDQLVGSPVSGGNSEPSMLCDDRRVHRVMLEAGIGREIANSFLVLASTGSQPRETEPPDRTMAWHFGAQRLRRWIRHQIVEEQVYGRRIRTVGPDRLAPRTHGWLSQDPVKDEPYVIGTTIWERAIDASRRRDEDSLREALGLWRQAIDPHRKTSEQTNATHPFLFSDTRETLPPDHLDLCLSNFVIDGDRVEFIDREWLAEPAVDADLVMVRALWLLAQGLIRHHGFHPWAASLTIDELTIELGRLAGLPAEHHLQRLYEAEATLQVLVTGRTTEKIASDFRWIREHRPTDLEAVHALPISRIHDLLEFELPRLQDETNRARDEVRRLEGEVEHERGTAARLGGELSATHERLSGIGAKLEEVATALGEANGENAELREKLAEVEALRHRIDELQGERDSLQCERNAIQIERDTLQAWRDAFEGRLPVRLLRRIQRLIH